MAQRRKLTLASVIAFGAVATLCLLPARFPTHDGRSVKAWFDRYEYLRNQGYYDATRGAPSKPKGLAYTKDSCEAAFRQMGTNAAPFLADRINQSLDYSPFDLWRFRTLQRAPPAWRPDILWPAVKDSEAHTATMLMAQIKPPGELLLPLIQPALSSANARQLVIAIQALREIRSGHDLARPILERALTNENQQVRWAATYVIRGAPEHNHWAVHPMLAAALSPDFDTFESAIHALNLLRPASKSVLPELRDRSARELDPKRREVLEHSIQYISDFPPGE